MARDFAKQFYKSKQWQKCRASYILKRQGIDGGMCETCHQEPGKLYTIKYGSALKISTTRMYHSIMKI